MLFESIAWRNGQFQLLDQHTARVQRARRDVLGLDDQWNLEHILASPAANETLSRLRQISVPDQLYKIRFVYHRDTWHLTWQPYIMKAIKSVMCIESAPFEYQHKFENRTNIEALAARALPHEVLICMGGKVRDTSYCNVVFAEGGKTKKLYTPAEPLLPGVQRAHLIAQGQIEIAEIKLIDLQHFKSIYLINAMIPLGHLSVPISRVIKAY
jgi:4-amino-4-deoxychorismate lyase